MAKPLSRRYTPDSGSIGYQCGDAWLRADNMRNGYVRFAKFGHVPLNASQCRTLAAWLNKQADKMETKP